MPYIENIGEAGFACLLTMVQGNVLMLGITHWIIASQTGLIAGTIAGTTILAARLRRRWIISLTLGGITAIVDFFIHPGHFGIAAITEAAVTGVGAAVLSYLVGGLLTLIRRRPGAAA